MTSKIKALEIEGKPLAKGVVLCDAGDAKDQHCVWPLNAALPKVGYAVTLRKDGDAYFAGPAEAAPAAKK